MADLLQIEEPGGARRAAPQWGAFLELGFRPLYLAGCAWAALSVA
ncbi:MAG: NnrS family protein, partial [Hydrogenophaga sp.]